MRLGHPQPTPLHRAMVAGLVLMLILTSTLVALRGIAMMNHMALLDQATHCSTPQPSAHAPSSLPKSHLEHCSLCFAQWIETSSAEDLTVKRLEVTHLRRLHLYAAQAKNEFLQTVVPRGPPGLL